MGADAIATIRPVLNEIFVEIQNDAPDAENLCATFEAAGRSTAWVQVVSNTINFSYAGSDDPLAFLTEQGVALVPDCAVVAWDKGLVVTVSHASQDADAVAQFVDGVFNAVHGLGEDLAVAIKLERL